MAGSFPAAGKWQLNFGMIANAAALARPDAVLKLVPEIMTSMEATSMASMESFSMTFMETIIMSFMDITSLCGFV